MIQTNLPRNCVGFLLLCDLRRSAIYGSHKFDSHKWPTVLVEEVESVRTHLTWCAITCKLIHTILTCSTILASHTITIIIIYLAEVPTISIRAVACESLIISVIVTGSSVGTFAGKAVVYFITTVGTVKTLGALTHKRRLEKRNVQKWRKTKKIK